MESKQHHDKLILELSRFKYNKCCNFIESDNYQYNIKQNTDRLNKLVSRFQHDYINKKYPDGVYVNGQFYQSKKNSFKY